VASDIRDIGSRRSDLNLYFIEDSHVYHMNDLKELTLINGLLYQGAT
jgi:hypothetical protein